MPNWRVEIEARAVVVINASTAEEGMKAAEAMKPLVVNPASCPVLGFRVKASSAKRQQEQTIKGQDHRTGIRLGVEFEGKKDV